jgi:hypothetical protein
VSDDADFIVDLGHLVATIFCAIGTLVASAAIYMGAI